MSLKRAVLIHYHEINLKKNNRGWFENRLKKHIEALLRDLPHGDIRRFAGRMFVALREDSPIPEIERRIRTAFGIANFAFTWEVPADVEAICFALAHLIEGKSFHSFRIESRRGTKEYPLNSQQLNERIGAFIQDRTRASVQMEDPDLTCHVELVGSHAYLYFEKIPGGGGLPSHSGGRVVCLVSGGIDSPVAAYRLMRRGCQVIYVHFHSFPHTTIESQEKVRRIVAVLCRYQLHSKLYMIPFAELQREIVAFAPPSLRVILYRRFMVRIAEAIARRERAAAMVTGDSLGQVASQTLKNLAVVSSAARLPIFRPLIGDDKEDIIRVARAIGTYEISIVPDQDCCTLFVPKHPETMARLDEVERSESAFDLSRLTGSAVDLATREIISPDFSYLYASVV